MKTFRFTALVILIFTLCAWHQPHSLKGNWQFAGGVYNGKAEQGPTDYAMQRKYTDTTFNAYLLEPDQKPVCYQRGRYAILTDSCLETETFSAQPSNLTGKTIHYLFAVAHDTLTFTGVLPNGMQVKEYWKKVK